MGFLKGGLEGVRDPFTLVLVGVSRCFQSVVFPCYAEPRKGFATAKVGSRCLRQNVNGHRVSSKSSM